MGAITDIYRDIHRNNVLVTSQSTPNDPFFREEIVLLLNDFGEGRASDAPRFLGRKYYGNTEFWAPEVKSSKHYSFKSDVYAVGYLMADMILARFQAVQACTGLADRSVPRILLDLTVSCLAENEQQRPTAKELRVRLEDFMKLHCGRWKAGIMIMNSASPISMKYPLKGLISRSVG